MTNKDTDTMEDLEKKLFLELKIIKDPEVQKDIKLKALQKAKILQKFIEDVNYKKINGKKYNTREVPPKVTKKELLELIDSVDAPFDFVTEEKSKDLMNVYGDLSGVSPGMNRFVFKEKGSVRTAILSRDSKAQDQH